MIKNIHIRIDNNLFKLVKILAIENRLSINKMIGLLIELGCNHYKTEIENHFENKKYFK